MGVAFTVIFFIATGIFMLFEWGILGLFLQYFKYIRKHGFLMASGWLFSRMVPVPGHIGELERAARISDPRAGTALVRLKNKLVKAAATHQRMKYILRIGCLTRDGPALWQLLRHPTVFGRGGYVAPERYLEGAGEMFILMIIVCWMITLRCASGRVSDVAPHTHSTIAPHSSPLAPPSTAPELIAPHRRLLLDAEVRGKRLGTRRATTLLTSFVRGGISGR